MEKATRYSARSEGVGVRNAQSYRQANMAEVMSVKLGTRTGISIVIVNHNAGELLAKCVDSALPSSDETIIVDNASHDTSVEDAVRVNGNYRKIKVVNNAENIGFSAACNIGYQAANSEAVLFLNPDCQLSGNAVAEMIRVLTSERSCGMVGSLLINPDGSEQGGGRRAVPTPWRSFVRAFGLYRLTNRWPRLFFDFHLHKQPLPNKNIEVEAISGACMMVKREAVEDVGLWGESYFLHCEDLDWCMRFRNKGWKILFVPSARVVHQFGACSQSRPFFVEWHKHKGMIRFYHKFFRRQYPLGLMGLVTLGVWFRFGLVCIHRSGRLLTGLLKASREQ